MFKGLTKDELWELLEEYSKICAVCDVDKKGWMTFAQFVVLRTGIGIEEQIKLYRMNQKIDKIEEDF